MVHESYKSQTAILEEFEKIGGIKGLLMAAASSLDKWKNQKLKKKIQLYLDEIVSFNTIPEFLSQILALKRSKKFLFDILAGKPDSDTNKKVKRENELSEAKWESECNVAVTSAYKVLSSLFLDTENIELRNQAIKTNLIQMILLRIQTLSGEFSRKYIDVELEKEKSLKILEEKKEEVSNVNKKKRKGVGYTTNVGEVSFHCNFILILILL